MPCPELASLTPKADSPDDRSRLSGTHIAFGAFFDQLRRCHIQMRRDPLKSLQRDILMAAFHGADGTGASGLQDRVNYHWGRVFLAAGLATILNLGLERGAESEDDVARAIREAAQDTIGRTGDEIVRQQLAVRPTLTIRPGFPVRVMVTRDLILEPLGEVR